MTDISHSGGSAIRASRRVRVRPDASTPRVPASLVRRLNRGPVRHGSPRRRLVSTWLVAIIVAGALIARLVQLQVSPSEQLVAAGEEQRIKSIPIDYAYVDKHARDTKNKFSEIFQ